MEYEIITDVSADIDIDVVNDNDIKFVKMDYSLSGQSYICTGPISDEDLHNFYESLRHKEPTSTSLITPNRYIESFTPYIKEHKRILYLALSSGLSSTYDSAVTAANMLKDDYPEAEIEIIDSLGATGGMGLILEVACANRKKGMSLSENAAFLRDNVKKVDHWFKVEDLMYLQRGGRISAATAIVGTALNIKPILTIRADGHLDTIAKKRGDKQAFEYLISKFEEDYNKEISNVVYILHADCPEGANKLLEQALAVHPEANIKIRPLSPIIGAHTGPDMLAIVFFGKERD